MEIASCTPWQHFCRTYGLDFPTSPTITGVRGAAGGRQPAAAKPASILIFYEWFLRGSWPSSNGGNPLQIVPRAAGPQGARGIDFYVAS